MTVALKMSSTVSRVTVTLSTDDPAAQDYLHQTVHFTDVFRQCTCTSTQVQKYQKRISGPLLDRIDIQIEVPRLSEDELLQSRPAEASRDIRARVKRARAAQAERFAKQVPLPSRERPGEGEIEVGEAGISEEDKPPQIMQQFALFRSSSSAGAVPPTLPAKRYCASRNSAHSTATPRWDPKR